MSTESPYNVIEPVFTHLVTTDGLLPDVHKKGDVLIAEWKAGGQLPEAVNARRWGGAVLALHVACANRGRFMTFYATSGYFECPICGDQFAIPFGTRKLVTSMFSHGEAAVDVFGHESRQFTLHHALWLEDGGISLSPTRPNMQPYIKA